MTEAQEFAHRITAQIVVSRMQNSSVIPNKAGGIIVAEFYKEIYKWILKLVTSDTNE